MASKVGPFLLAAFIAAGAFIVSALGAPNDVLAASTSSGSIRAWPAKADVLVVGDSLTFGEHALGGQKRAYRIAGLILAVDASSGRFASAGLAVLARSAPLPEVVVFALGTNDACSARTDYLQQLIRARTLARGSKFVVVTLYAPKCPRFERLNTHIRAFASRHSAVEVVHWDRAVARNPVWVSADGVHLTALGYQARAMFLAAAAAKV
jgi:lysophospholipase L1-like esterase